MSQFFGRKSRAAKEALAKEVYDLWIESLFQAVSFRSSYSLMADDRPLTAQQHQKLLSGMFADILEDSFGIKKNKCKTKENPFNNRSLAELQFFKSIFFVLMNSNGEAHAEVKKYSGKKRAFLAGLIEEITAQKAQVSAKQHKKEAQAKTNAQKTRLKDVLGGVDLISWLVRHGPDPDLWHIIAVNTDPDTRNEMLYFWIVTQPDCDAATALHIFHALNSFEALERPAVDSGSRYALSHRISKIIADRWDMRSFPTYEFSFSCMGYEEAFTTYEAKIKAAEDRFGAPAFRVTPDMFEYRTGRDADSKYVYSDFD